MKFLVIWDGTSAWVGDHDDLIDEDHSIIGYGETLEDAQELADKENYEAYRNEGIRWMTTYINSMKLNSKI